jgi:hypothetical protein
LYNKQIKLTYYFLIINGPPKDQQCFKCFDYFTKDEIDHHEEVCLIKNNKLVSYKSNNPFSPKNENNSGDYDYEYANLNEAAMTFGGRRTTTNKVIDKKLKWTIEDIIQI